MCNLIELENGNFKIEFYIICEINSRFKKMIIHEFVGNRTNTIKSLERQKINQRDIKFAFEMIDNKGHNIVNFGVLGNFIFSKFEGMLQ